MSSPLFDSIRDRPPTLAVRSRVAAEIIGISERHLAKLTKAGDVPVVRLGRTVLYPVASLKEWLAGNTTCKEASHATH